MRLTDQENELTTRVLKKFVPEKYDPIRELTLAGFYGLYSLRQSLINGIGYGFDPDFNLTRSEAIDKMKALIHDPFLGHTVSELNSWPVGELTNHYLKPAVSLHQDPIHSMDFSFYFVDGQICESSEPAEMSTLTIDINTACSDAEIMSGVKKILKENRDSMSVQRKTRKHYIDVQNWVTRKIPAFMDYRLACNIADIKENKLASIRHFLPGIEQDMQMSGRIYKTLNELMHPYLCSIIREEIVRAATNR